VGVTRAIGQVLSSPTYRALETIKFAQLGKPTKYPQLGDDGQSMIVDKSGARGAWLRTNWKPIRQRR
jgi:hypothetical protein